MTRENQIAMSYCIKNGVKIAPEATNASGSILRIIVTENGVPKDSNSLYPPHSTLDNKGNIVQMGAYDKINELYSIIYKRLLGSTKKRSVNQPLNEK